MAGWAGCRAEEAVARYGFNTATLDARAVAEAVREAGVSSLAGWARWISGQTIYVNAGAA